MTYTLAIGDRSYSSWSLRGWLMFAAFDIPVTVRTATMKTPGFTELLSDFGHAVTVPAADFGEGAIVWDSIAIAESLADRHPGLWPDDPAAKALARNLVAEMHSGFSSLRGSCPMILRTCYEGFEVTDAIRADLARIETLWAAARALHGDKVAQGPWLFGRYSLADAFFAPVVTRIVTWGLPVNDPATHVYVAAHLAHQPFRQWRAMGEAEAYVQPGYHPSLKEKPWPGPKVIKAEAVAGVIAVNAICPYSGKPVQEDSLARIDGVVVGFCNTFCRDKTVADPEAWPKAMAVVAQA